MHETDVERELEGENIYEIHINDDLGQWSKDVVASQELLANIRWTKTNGTHAGRVNEVEQ